MCLYAKKNEKISMQGCNYITVYHSHSYDFCSQPRLTQSKNKQKATETETENCYIWYSYSQEGTGRGRIYKDWA